MNTLSSILRVLLASQLLLANSGFAVEPNQVDLNLQKDLLRLEVQVAQTSQTQTVSALSQDAFPSNRPDGLEKALALTSFSAPYDLYIWQQSGYLFGEMVPTSSAEVFLCSSSWILVQSLNDLVAAFNTTRFVNSAGETICEDYSQSIIFEITQWEFLYDTLADLSQPLNIVNNQYADLSIPVNGGVTGTGSVETGQVSSTLDISIPSIELVTEIGNREIWLELIFSGSLDEGSYSWTLGDAGFK